jgi:metal-responsive CopG/Arc/MetJ family transcriptional regulator
MEPNESKFSGKLGMADLAREQRLQIMLTEEELRTIDDWRFERRMPTRASAVRELLRRGLTAEGFLSADAGEKSQGFGVIANQHSRIGDGDGAPD